MLRYRRGVGLPRIRRSRASPPRPRAWFAATFAAPTAAQTGAWDAIASGRARARLRPHRLRQDAGRVPLGARPTGRSARARRRACASSTSRRSRRSPSTSSRTCARRWPASAAPRRGWGSCRRRSRRRSAPATPRPKSAGDSPKHPPDILVTTPESIFLLLTSAARDVLRTVETVIVDEVHAVAGTKRGAHLALTLERLDCLLSEPAQRIGLSATVRPLEEVARFLGGAQPVDVVAAPGDKTLDLSVVVPVEDMAILGQATGDVGSGARRARRSGTASGRTWRSGCSRLIRAHRSTIVFANSRRLAERLCARLNELAGEEVARAHHGSVSREQRAEIEEALRTGRIPAVVATSSLELGHRHGRGRPGGAGGGAGVGGVGPAAHRARRAPGGRVSRGVFFPKYRGDLLEMRGRGRAHAGRRHRGAALPAQPARRAGAADRRDGRDGRLDGRRARADRAPRGALRRPAARRARRRARHALRPLPVRPGGRAAPADHLGPHDAAAHAAAQRAAAGGHVGRHHPGPRALRRLPGRRAPGPRRRARRGDGVRKPGRRGVPARARRAGASRTSRHDRVLVSPAPGQPGKMPFWRGDAPGRPLELGAAIGRFVRELGELGDDGARRRLRDGGLDEWAADNLVRYLAEQREATGAVPDDRTIVVERFRDAVGDWRVCVHSFFGARVHAPWARAIEARLRQRLGIAVQTMYTDDGIVVRVPDADDAPPADAVFFDPEEVEELATAEVGDSALFASRFRECAARALLLPRRRPGARTPLWQQRQKSAALLQVASRHPSFPIMLETYRECLQDVFDLPALAELLSAVRRRDVRVVEVDTPAAVAVRRLAPVRFRERLPLRGRRAAGGATRAGALARSLPAGRADGTRRAARAARSRRAGRRSSSSCSGWATTGARAMPTTLHDRCATLGDLTHDEAACARRRPRAARCARACRPRAPRAHPRRRALDRGRGRRPLPRRAGRGAAGRRAARLPRAGAGSAGRPRRALGPRRTGRSCPPTSRHGSGSASRWSSRRCARSSSTAACVDGEFRPGGSGREWVDVEVLRRLAPPLAGGPAPRGRAGGARAAGALRAGVAGRRRGGGQAAHARRAAARGRAAAGRPAAGLRARVADPARRGCPATRRSCSTSSAPRASWCGRAPARSGRTTAGSCSRSPTRRRCCCRSRRRSSRRRWRSVCWTCSSAVARASSVSSARRSTPATTRELLLALWDLVWAGRVTNDTVAPLRAMLHRRRSRPRDGRPRRVPRPTRFGPPAGAGRWSLVPPREPDATRRLHAVAEQLLLRHGVVTRGAVMAERVPGGFAGVYPVLKAFEEVGRCRRGYFVEGLGGAQFAQPGAVDRLRGLGDPDGSAQVLAATDPANPYGAALPWPDRGAIDAGHRPGRKAGAAVVLVDGALVLYVERGGRTLLSYGDDETEMQRAADALAVVAREGKLGRLAAAARRRCGGARRAGRARAGAGRLPPHALGHARPCLRATPSSSPRRACARRWPARRSPAPSFGCRALPPPI